VNENGCKKRYDDATPPKHVAASNRIVQKNSTAVPLGFAGRSNRAKAARNGAIRRNAYQFRANIKYRLLRVNQVPWFETSDPNAAEITPASYALTTSRGCIPYSHGRVPRKFGIFIQ
jgi:hypothetical protein